MDVNMPGRQISVGEVPIPFTSRNILRFNVSPSIIGLS